MPYTPLRSSANIAGHLQVGVAREADYLDFKGAIPYPGQSDLDDRRECALDIAQFANATGGTLVIGATDANTVLTGFQSVSDPGKLRPVPVFDCQEIATTSGARITTVNIQTHPTLVARYKDARYEFVVRTGPRKRHIEMDELEARMQGRERLMRFRLERIPPTASIGLDARLHNLTHNGWRVVAVTEDIVRLRKDARELAIPLPYMDAVYRAEEPDAE